MAHVNKQMISLFLSAECNLNCGYCYVPKGGNIAASHRRINVNFAKKAIEDYFNQTQNYYIRFFGAGEPTMAYAEMKAIYDYAYKLSNGRLKAELQTNGFFNNEVADWVEKNIDVLWISFDGLPELQDIQRPTIDMSNSSGRVLENIYRFANCTKMQFGVRVTVSNQNFYRQTEILKYLKSIGVKYVCGSPCYISTVNDSFSKPAILEFAEHFVKAYYYAQENDMFYQTHLMVNFDKETYAYCRACIPSPHVTTDGYVTCCDWALFGEQYLPGPLQQLVYGKYDSENDIIIYDKERINYIKKRNVEFLGENSCKGCTALRNCAGGCIGKTIVISNNIYTPSEEWCLATKYLFEHLPVNQGDFPCYHS